MSIKDTIRCVLPKSSFEFLHSYYMATHADTYSTNGVSAVLKLFRWSFYKLTNKDIFFVTPRGFKYISMPKNYSSKVVYLRDYRDPNIQKLMEAKIAKGSIFVDAGANIGTYTVPAAKLVGDTGKVIAIEAHPYTFTYLQKNIALNGLTNVQPINVALGSEYGTIEMSYDNSNPGETHVSTGENQKVSVPLQTLDEVLSGAGVGTVTYLKIDVEGFEYPLLQGARETIANNAEIIIQTELNEHHASRYGNSNRNTIELLKSFGLTPHIIDSQGTPHTTDLINLKEENDVLWWRE